MAREPTKDMGVTLLLLMVGQLVSKWRLYSRALGVTAHHDQGGRERQSPFWPKPNIDVASRKVNVIR
jgi:hypothetical protein